MQATNAANVCDLKFSSSHIKFSESKQMKGILIICFIYFSMSKILSCQHVINIDRINEGISIR